MDGEDATLASQRLGSPRLHLRQTDSTNERARALALAGAPHGTLVTADEQTAGRGRQGRRWWAPPRSALLMSLLLRAHAAEALPALMSLAVAVAVCDVAGDDALVKWPNDVVLRRGDALAKLGGILLEGRPQEGWVVVGVGLNVAVDRAQIPLELQATAATLGRGRNAIEPLLDELLPALERRLASSSEQMLAAWRRRDALLDARVAWSGGAGIAEGVDGTGRLLVAAESGQQVALDSGEVHLL